MVNPNLQREIHLDADQLSIFVEGVATAREKEQMLAHLADCAECRNAVFLMQPHEETQRTSAMPVKGWVWRWLVPVGLPAAALACGLIVFFVYTRPRRAAPSISPQIASVRQSEIERPGPGTTVAPTANSETVARSEKPKNAKPNVAAPNLSPEDKRVADGFISSRSVRRQTAANVAPPQAAAAAPSVPAPNADAARSAGSTSTGSSSELPLNGRNFTQPQQSPTSADVTAQNNMAKKKDLAALQIQPASDQAETLAGVSGHITDRSGAVVAGATVTLRDQAGNTRQTTTSADGSFHLTGLPAGQYELTAVASGFTTIKQSVELKPSEVAKLKAMLDVGTTSEQVTVEAQSSALQVQTESANAGGQAIAETRSLSRIVPVPNGPSVRASVSHGKRTLSLDDTGNLFLSRNGGKKWKKINPQWSGKAVSLELTPAYSSNAPPKAKDEMGPANKGAVFQLTTDTGAVWSSKDGAHWHQ